MRWLKQLVDENAKLKKIVAVLCWTAKCFTKHMPKTVRPARKREQAAACDELGISIAWRGRPLRALLRHSLAAGRFPKAAATRYTGSASMIETAEAVEIVRRILKPAAPSRS